MTDIAEQRVDIELEAEIVTERNSGWACVVVPGSKQIFGTGKAVKISGTIDGLAFDATMLPVGDGQHMIPIKAATRKSLGKGIGDRVGIEITQRPS